MYVPGTCVHGLFFAFCVVVCSNVPVFLLTDATCMYIFARIEPYTYAHDQAVNPGTLTVNRWVQGRLFASASSVCGCRYVVCVDPPCATMVLPTRRCTHCVARLSHGLSYLTRLLGPTNTIRQLAMSVAMVRTISSALCCTTRPRTVALSFSFVF